MAPFTNTLLRYLQGSIWRTGRQILILKDIGYTGIESLADIYRFTCCFVNSFERFASILGLFVRPPKLFVCGHSHILKVQYDKTLNMLYINPGAAGIYGFHKVRTLVRFAIDNGEFKDLEVIELAEENKKG